MMSFTNTVWVLQIILQLCLIVFLVRRGAHRTFRLFFGYTVFAVAAEFVKYELQKYPLIYFYTYWSAEALYSILGFAALYEVFDHAFRHLYSLQWVRFSFPGAAVLMLAVAALWIFIHGQPVHDQPFLTVIFGLEIAVRLLQIGFFIVIFLLAVYFEEYSQQYAFGIAAGFGVAALGMLVMVVVRSEFGTTHMVMLRLVGFLAYFVAVVIWLASFVRQQPPDYFARLRHRWNSDHFLKLIEQWKQRAKEILRPWLDIMHSGSGSY
ncbi:MAG TPA: hypothetical protein VG649_21270 [Candidatus Angelobacter sp.]|jgi:hypothetical protein|nr:hypothetical protein [Candidatus Angelobacter sp.]